MDNHISIEKNNRLIAIGITTLVAALLLIVILLIKFITPIPPFDESTKGGLEVNFGFDEAGMGENNSMDPVKNDQQTKTEATPQVQSNPADMISTEEPSEVVAPPVKNTPQEVKVETPPTPDKNLLDALNKVHSKPGSSSGDGNTDTPGNQGDINGTPNSPVYSKGKGRGGEGFVIRGAGRKMTGDVNIYDDSQETGIVAVEILVDKYGKITKAEPVLMGSTTTSSVLWKKAKDGLINQKLFNESGNGEEARGTIYINFTVR